MSDESLTLSISETARALGISRGLCYELVKQGKLPALRLGHRLLVPKASLNALLSEVKPNTAVKP